jgi:hypothetical protein
MNPFQIPRLEEIEAGGKFWGYLETEALRTRYVLAAHFVRDLSNIVEIGGYRGNVITNFLWSGHDSVTVYSLDAEFEPLEKGTLNGRACRVRHVRDYFQHYAQPTENLAVVALGLEIHGDIEPFRELLRRADRIVLEIASEHQPSVDCFDRLTAGVDLRTVCQINLDYSPNEPLLREQLSKTNMNTPFWRRSMFVLDASR